MGWFSRLVVRNSTIGLGLILKRIRFAEATATEYDRDGYPHEAAKWRAKQYMLERRFREMHADLDDRLGQMLRRGE